MTPQPTKNAPAAVAPANEGKASTYREETMNNATARPNSDATATQRRPRVFHEITRDTADYIETLCGRKIPRRRAIIIDQPAERQPAYCHQCRAMVELDAALDRAVSDESAAILNALDRAERKAAGHDR